MRTIIRQTADGRWVPRIVSTDKVPGTTLARCENHRHWTKVTARSCARQLIAQLARERETL